MTYYRKSTPAQIKAMQVAKRKQKIEYFLIDAGVAWRNFKDWFVSQDAIPAALEIYAAMGFVASVVYVLVK